VGEIQNIFKVKTEKAAVLLFNSVAAEKLLSENEILIVWAQSTLSPRFFFDKPYCAVAGVTGFTFRTED
jgi:hypothetical protein